MDYIVVYEKKARGNPIVAIHSQRFQKDAVELTDIHPKDNPDERGVVIVPGEIISRMVIQEFKRNEVGEIVQQPVWRCHVDPHHETGQATIHRC